MAGSLIMASEFGTARANNAASKREGVGSHEKVKSTQYSRPTSRRSSAGMNADGAAQAWAVRLRRCPQRGLTTVLGASRPDIVLPRDHEAGSRQVAVHGRRSTRRHGRLCNSNDRRTRESLAARWPTSTCPQAQGIVLLRACSFGTLNSSFLQLSGSVSRLGHVQVGLQQMEHWTFLFSFSREL